MSAFPITERAVDLAINEIKVRSIEEAERRGKVATRGTLNTLSVSVVPTPFGVTGTLEGEEQWKFVGNGRGPGGKPPIQNLLAWVNAGHQDVNAWVLQAKIAKEGSKDWRNNAPNVFISAIDDFEQGAGMERLEQESGEELETVVADLITKNLKARR